MVGRNFMIHPAVFGVGKFDEELDSHIGPMGNPLMSQEFYETDAKRGFVRGYSLIGERTFGPFSQSFGLPWGKEHHREFKKTFPHQAGLTAYIDDLPEPGNRVELSNEKTDSNGIAAAKVTYSLSDNSKKQLEHARLKVIEGLEASGAKSISYIPIPNGAHLMGTARMGTDPKKSVVNANHQSHDVRNLFIVDGSSFVTAAGVNPTSTIMALALRAADKIWELRGNWV
jgi:choline dehydrogenase-like flavoprotein